MADRAKTLMANRHAVSSSSASSVYGAPYSPSAAHDGKFEQGTGSQYYLSAATPAYPVYLRFDLGSAKTVDSCLIGTGYALTGTIKDGSIQYSSDDSSWSTFTSFADLFGTGVAPTFDGGALLADAAVTARYWRIKIDAIYGGTYASTSEWILWDSSTIGARLDNSVTLTATGFNTVSSAEFGNRKWTGATYALYDSGSVNSLRGYSIDLGSAAYIGGVDFVIYSSTGYWPTTLEVFTSTNGTTWTKQEDVTVSAWAKLAIVSATFSRIYSTRYIRLLFKNDTNGYIVYEGMLYATATPAAPPDPTSVVAKASATGTDIELTWSEIAGDDNLLADVVFDITRQKDGGGYSSIATGLTGQTYVDKSLAAGSYDYKVQARNLYHARTSSAVQSSASVTSPAAAGGGGAADGSRRYDPREVLC